MDCCSDVVWDKTHKVGSFIFRLIALPCFSASLFQAFLFGCDWCGVAQYCFALIYSYWVYKQEGHPKLSYSKKARRKK